MASIPGRQFPNAGFGVKEEMVTISKKVNANFGLKCLSLGATMLFLGLSTLPAHARSEQYAANATGSVDYTIQTPGWDMKFTVTGNEGGNLSQWGIPSSPAAIAGVKWGMTPKSRSGTVTYNYTYTWTGAPSGGVWTVNFTPKAYACFDRLGQTAHAQSHVYIPIVNVNGLGTQATAQTAYIPAYGSNDSFGFTTPANTLTVVMGVEVEADVTTP